MKKREAERTSEKYWGIVWGIGQIGRCKLLILKEVWLLR
jgi:hypothetical protein